jgi:hypothetical protein
MDTTDTNATPQAAPPAEPAAKPQSKFAQSKLYRIAMGIFGIIALVLGANQVYTAVRSNYVLPDCDSQRAKDTLSGIFKEHKFEPTRYESVKTVSSGKDEVVCNAVMPLPDGANLIADYTFFWDENKSAKIKYSMHRKAP